MPSAVLDTGLASLALARRATLEMLKSIPSDKLTHQPCANANHALWIMGHLAHTDDYFLTTLKGRPTRCPSGWGALFGMGSKPNPSAAAYPKVTELKEALANHREELLAWFKSMNQEQLAAPLPEDLQQFAANFGILMPTLAWHEGMHAGQLSVIRKSMGLAPVYG